MICFLNVEKCLKVLTQNLAIEFQHLNFHDIKIITGVQKD